MFSRRVKSPEYTRRQWIMKAFTLYLCAMGMELSGLQIYGIENPLAKTGTKIQFPGQFLNADAAITPWQFYMYAVHGLTMGLAFWKILEIYWWGKDRVSEANYIVSHKTIESSMKIPDSEVITLG